MAGCVGLQVPPQGQVGAGCGRRVTERFPRGVCGSAPPCWGLRRARGLGEAPVSAQVPPLPALRGPGAAPGLARSARSGALSRRREGAALREELPRD